MFSIFSIFSRSKPELVLPMSVADTDSTSTTGRPTAYDRLRAAWQAFVLALVFVFTCGHIPSDETCSIQQSNSTISSFYAPEREGNFSPSMSTASTMGPSLVTAAHVHSERRGYGNGVPVRVLASMRPDPYTRLPSRHFTPARRHGPRISSEERIASRNTDTRSHVGSHGIDRTGQIVAPLRRAALVFPPMPPVTPQPSSSPPSIAGPTNGPPPEEPRYDPRARCEPISDSPSPARYKRCGGLHTAKLLADIRVDATAYASESVQAECPMSRIPIINRSGPFPYKDQDCPNTSAAPKTIAPRDVPVIHIHESEHQDTAARINTTIPCHNLRVPEDDETSASRSTSPAASLFDPSLKSSSSFIDSGEQPSPTQQLTPSIASQGSQDKMLPDPEPQTKKSPRVEPKNEEEESQVEVKRCSISSVSVYSQDQPDVDDRSISSASVYSVQSDSEEGVGTTIELQPKNLSSSSSSTSTCLPYTNRFRKVHGDPDRTIPRAGPPAIGSGVPAEGVGNRCSQGQSLRSVPRFRVRMQDPAKVLATAKSELPKLNALSSSTPVRDFNLPERRGRRSVVTSTLRVQIPAHANGSNRHQPLSPVDQHTKLNISATSRPPTPISDPETPNGLLPSPPQTPAKRSSSRPTPDNTHARALRGNISAQAPSASIPTLPCEEHRRSTGPTTSSRLKTRRRAKCFVVGPEAPPVPALPSNSSSNPLPPRKPNHIMPPTPTITPPDSPKAPTPSGSCAEGHLQSYSEPTDAMRISAGRSRTSRRDKVAVEDFPLPGLGSLHTHTTTPVSNTNILTDRRKAVYLDQPASSAHFPLSPPTTLPTPVSISARAPLDHYAKGAYAPAPTPKMNGNKVACASTDLRPNRGRALRQPLRLGENMATLPPSMRGVFDSNTIDSKNTVKPKTLDFPSNVTRSSASRRDADLFQIGRTATQPHVWI